MSTRRRGAVLQSFSQDGRVVVCNLLERLDQEERSMDAVRSRRRLRLESLESRLPFSTTPVGTPDAFQVLKDHRIEFGQVNVLANDQLGGGAAYVRIIDNVNHGALALNHDGEFYYQPDRGFVGTDVFQYIVAREDGTASDPAYVLLHVVGPTSPGDADANGSVNLADFAAIKNAFGRQHGFRNGDFDLDGRVTLDDFMVLKENFGSEHSSQSTALTAQFTPIRPNDPSAAVDRVVLRFPAPVDDIQLSDFRLDRNLDDSDNLLTSDQRLVRLNDQTYELQNLRSLTSRNGSYTLLFGGGLRGLTARDGRPVASFSSDRFVVLPKFQASDDMLRMINRSSHVLWDHENYTNFFVGDGLSQFTLGVNARYDWPSPTGCIAGDPSDPFTGDFAGGSCESGREAYGRLYDLYKSEHPLAVTAVYNSSQSVMGVEAAAAQQKWPLDALDSRLFQPEWLTAAPPTSVVGEAGVDHTTTAGRTAHLNALALAGLYVSSPTGPLDAVQFDEVFYTMDHWEANVANYTELRRDLHENGMLVGVNLGGWGWNEPFFYGPDVVDELAEMVDAVQIENLWNKESRVAGGTFRTVQHTEKILSNLRRLMDAGVSVNLLASPTVAGHSAAASRWREQNSNEHDILRVSEHVDSRTGQTVLAVGMTEAHHIFPLGEPQSHRKGRFQFAKLPVEYQFLEGYLWHVEEIPGNPLWVLLRHRSGIPLESLKAQNGVERIDFSGGVLRDYQANVRLLAAMIMMVRRPGDAFYLHDSPGDDPPGTPTCDDGKCDATERIGDPEAPGAWWYWPRQFGRPTSDVIYDSIAADGRIERLHRDFEFGSIEILPQSGAVLLHYNASARQAKWDALAASLAEAAEADFSSDGVHRWRRARL